MSAEQKISLNTDTDIQKLAIIAGSGTLPRDLYQRCLSFSIECHVIGFKGYTNYITPDFWGKFSQASQIIQYLKKHDIEHLVFIGGVHRPKLRSLRPDWITLKFLLKVWRKSFGDSSLLSAIRHELEVMGFFLHGIHQFLPELLMPEGTLGGVQVLGTAQDDIALGVDEALKLGECDKGQAVIVKEGVILAREGTGGTSRMIELHGVENSILVKMCKPQQDRDMDLPTIGPKTIQLCAEKKMAGIVGHAGHMLMVEQEKTVQLANQKGLFILGRCVDG